MGEVYRARDGKLDRDVAIKVLPTHLASDPEALARFEREAKAVAALSHPNILAIHDFARDETNGVSYAVMELLEGGTLRERLEAGALPAKKVVQIGVDIAQGLAAAHARGIIHRDLKPENVFVTADGRVKILDFGLARPIAMTSDGTNSPTALRQTNPGTVLGTVGYMSPEQVKGLPADHRSDVFSLGCVLYELATGRRAFQRETPAETMTAILREDPPDFARESGAAPAAIEPMIRHCLEKQPDERFQSARDLAFALQTLSGTAASSSGSSGPSALGSGAHAAPAAVRRRAPLVPLVLGAILIAAAFFAGRALTTSDVARLPVAFQQLTDDAGVETDPVISPDGASVAFTRVARGHSDIFVQRIGGRNAILVAGEPGRREAAPAFSPDGASIAFHESAGKGGIFIAGATGESARRLTDFGFHPSWSPDGSRVLFCSEEIVSPASRTSTSPLWIADVKGGAPRKISDGDGVQPSWSPSGRRIVYWAVDTGQRDLFTMSADGGTRTAVTSDAALDWNPIWASDGFVYFASDRGGAMNIWRIAMDESSGAPRGAPEPVTAGVASAEQPSLTPDASRLVFRSSVGAVNPIAMSFDPATGRLGPPRQILDRTGSLVPTAVSPNGEWLALSNVLERREDVFIVRTDGTAMRRLTDDEFRDRLPVWSPDGTELAFYSNRTDNYAIWAVKPDGSGLRQVSEDSVTGNLGNLIYPAYSPTGDRLIASRSRSGETILFNPRVAWKTQTPDRLATTLPDGSWLVPSSWSPDGRHLVGAISAAGSTVGIGLYDVSARSVKKLYDGQAPLWGYTWLADSRRVLYTIDDSLWQIDVDTGQRRELMAGFPFGLGLTLAPDGRTLYASLAKLQADVWLVELKTKRP